MFQNARIRSTSLGYHDGPGSIPTAWVHLDYGVTAQSFGGYKMGGDFTHRFVYGVLDTLEAESWEGLVGLSCRVEIVDDKVQRIGHFLKEKWFDPR